MTTLLETILPATSDLDTLVGSAILPGESESDFKDRTLKNIIAVINEKPETYRAYGAWWFTIKKMIVEDAGYLGFGINVGEGEADVYRYKSDTHTLIAAWLYMNERVESGAIYSNSHMLDTDPSVDDEGYEYYLIDDSVESLISYRDGFKK